ncbi:MAG: N-6 DNA methylase [Lentisphaeria bacterium]|nr:N-6 DNA methylase [Lentisphaeria bacterium]
MTTQDIVQKLWNLCDVLRDDGITYHQYVTELTYLLFLKMAKETGVEDKIPEGYRWDDLTRRKGIELKKFYEELLRDLGGDKSKGRIKEIYTNARTDIQHPVNLAKLISEINKLDWYEAKKEGLGDLYEGLLEKNANEKKSGAGQYFTPRPLIDSMVRLVKPKLGERCFDPAAGTFGFMIAANQYIEGPNSENKWEWSTAQRNFQRQKAFAGVELVQDAHRLALMNAMLHDIDGALVLGDSLSSQAEKLKDFDVILTNPPFGTKKGGEQPTRSDLTFPSSNKQLNFLQIIYRSLKKNGKARAAVVIPDNVLFEAGVGTQIRRDLMDKCDLHTILRLPTGIFYAQGVKTNVLFFTRGTTEKDNTKHVWVYDLRSNMPSFGKRTPFSEQHLAPFEAVYGDNPDGSSPRKEGEWSFMADGLDQTEENSRWRCFSRDWIRDTKGDSLDISWIKDSDSVDAANLPEPDVLAAEAMGELTEALRELDGLMTALGKTDEAEAQKTLLAEVLGLNEEAEE